MKQRRIMIAAPRSGSGKTMLTCALLQVLADRGEKVRSYKCGPDYIDPMFHRTVFGVPSGNLDTFFTGAEETRGILTEEAGEEDLAVMEGVMGLFDGLGGTREEGSSYHLAKVTKTPIVLVADVRGMGARSMLPLIAGFLSYDKEKLIKGVILNRISAGYFGPVKAFLEKELPVPLLGYLPEMKDLHVESRHLGLIMPKELLGIREKLRAAAQKLEETVSVPAILKIAEETEELESPAEAGREEERGGRDRAVIAVARDEAFCFYYRENLALLAESGARLVYFSPLHDKELPPGCHGILLGGGYPELYAQKLSQNDRMHRQIREAARKGMPLVAECGGFLYLHAFLTDQNGVSYPMAGVLPSTCFYTDRPVRFGYIEVEDKSGFFLPAGERIKGHEYHYYESADNGNGAFAVKPMTGKTYPCAFTRENCWIGFPHLYYPSNPVFAHSFVEKAARYKVEKITDN